VPKVRKQGRRPLDRTKLSTAVAAALEQLWRNESLRRPVTPRWLKKHLAAFDEFASKDGRLAKAHNLCLHHEMDLAECVLKKFLGERDLPEMDCEELGLEAYKVAVFLRERRSHVPLSRCRECCKETRLAHRVVRAFERGGELAACRLMTEIGHRYGYRAASKVWSALMHMHAEEQHPYFQYHEGGGSQWRPRLHLACA
jgi:hypothetical protein